MFREHTPPYHSREASMVAAGSICPRCAVVGVTGVPRKPQRNVPPRTTRKHAYDTVLQRCETLTKPIPSANARRRPPNWGKHTSF
jgi:hypothetical protein